MQTYFTANQPHLQDHIDISSAFDISSKSIISIGIDSLIYVKNIHNNIDKTIYLNEKQNFNIIEKSNQQNSCFLEFFTGSYNGVITHFNLQTEQSTQIYTSPFNIHSLTLSPQSRYLCASTQQSKPILIDLSTNKISKCRPGHESSVVSASFSHDQKYLASIGMDKNLLIYNVMSFEQPLQMYRIRISKQQTINLNMKLSGCWNKLLPIYYSPGQRQLRIFQLLNSRWQPRPSCLIHHPFNIIHLVQCLKNLIIITSSLSEIILWNNKNEQKLVHIEQSFFYKVIEIDEKIYGVKGNGKIYQYNKIIVEDLYGQRQRMEIQGEIGNHNVYGSGNQEHDNSNDVINFDQPQAQDEQKQDIQSNISQQQQEYLNRKKSKADQIIKTFPQQRIMTNTSFFDGCRYLYTNQYGYLIEQIQTGSQNERNQQQQQQNQTRIYFQSQDQSKNQNIFHNKIIITVHLQRNYLVYGCEMSFGVKFIGKMNQYQAWEKTWLDVGVVTGSGEWVAVANEEEIRVFDLVGNQLKTMCFDRQIVAMTAYENLLAVVYHESVPIWGHQCLAMQLYVINPQKSSTLICSSCHVPIKPKSSLKYFRFSSQGMLISQDTYGQIRLYNLQYNCWTSVTLQGIEDTRRIWLLGMQNYQVVYWRTTQINPDPLVFPRLPVKRSRLGINSIIMINSTQSIEQNYPYLMFERFCLDHEKCRTRLWGHLRFIRSQSHFNYSNISGILCEKGLMKHHNQLDFKFFDLIKYYIKEKAYHKVVITAKTLIRTIQAGKQLVQMIDQCKLRYLAVELEKYYDERRKELEYGMMQQMDMQILKGEAEKNVKPKAQNPFAIKKKNNDTLSIPSLNSSQISQQLNFDNLSDKSAIKTKKQNGIALANKTLIDTPQKEQITNPFLKKRAHDDYMNFKSKQIQDQIQKFGIKKKTQIKKINIGHRNF